MVSDEILDRFAVIGTYDVIGRQLLARFDDVVTHAEFSIPVRNALERDTLALLGREIHASATAMAERALREGLP